MRAILEIASHHELAVIEDACQAHGAKFRDGEWKRAGSFGRAAAFSFYPTKNLGAFGDAGFVLTSDRDLLDRVRLLAQGGQRLRNLAAVPGYNSRGDEVQAAILNCKIKHLDEWNERRRVLAGHYTRLLRLPGLRLQHVPESCEHVYHLYVVRHALRNQLRVHLHDRGIDTMTHYPVALHRQPAFTDPAQVVLPEAERAADEVISLPLHPTLSEAEVEEVASAINDFAG
jgi:dTDP-4-amino-4,6-dideoxygalactose transaminase